MQYVICFLLAISATTMGSITGMGGGVLIKPLMDALHCFDVETIGMLSSIAVFAMTVVSIGKRVWAKDPIPFSVAIPLAVGATAGGYAGQAVLRRIVTLWEAQARITAIQNILLSLLILAVYFYMKQKGRIPGRNLSGVRISLAAGTFLGLCSSFLGIGGGPINVALIVYLYSMGTKQAAVCSLITILFAQTSKLATVLLTTGFSPYDLSAAPIMAIGAVLGGFWGTALSKRFSEQSVEKAFNAMQLAVLAVAVFNIVRNLLAIR